MEEDDEEADRVVELSLEEDDEEADRVVELSLGEDDERRCLRFFVFFACRERPRPPSELAPLVFFSFLSVPVEVVPDETRRTFLTAPPCFCCIVS